MANNQAAFRKEAVATINKNKLALDNVIKTPTQLVSQMDILSNQYASKEVANIESPNVNATAFHALCIAAQIVLHDQSKMGGKETKEKHCGIVVDTETAQQITAAIKQQTYTPHLFVSLVELCKYGYGEDNPTSRQKKQMAQAIDQLHSIPMKITYADGSILEKYLCVKSETYTDAKTKAKMYHLSLNPIFCTDIKRFCQLPRNIVFRIKDACKKLKCNIDEDYYSLLYAVAPFVKKGSSNFTLEFIADKLRATEYMNKNRNRFEKKVLNILKCFKEIGLLVKYEMEIQKKQLTKLTLYYNVDFCKNSSLLEDKNKQENPPQN